MRIRGSGSGQPLRSPHVDDMQRAVVARIVYFGVVWNRRRGKILSVVRRLRLRKCGEIWRTHARSGDAENTVA